MKAFNIICLIIFVFMSLLLAYEIPKSTQAEIDTDGFTMTGCIFVVEPNEPIKWNQFEQECPCGLLLSGSYEGDEYYFKCFGCERAYAYAWQGQKSGNNK